MKKLISAQDIKNAKAAGLSSIVAPKGETIITPEARDIASNLGITIVQDTKTNTPALSNPDTASIVKKEIEAQLGHLSSDKSELITRLITKELQNFNVKAPDCARQINDNGIVLIRGNAVSLDKFDGAPNQNIGLKDCVGHAENSHNMGVGYMGWENAFFPWTLTYDEVDVILEGELHIKTDAGVTIGKPGDVIFIPKGSKIEFGTNTSVKFVYITNPVMSF